MYSGQKYIRDNLIEQIQAIVDGDKATQGLKDAFAKFIETKDKTLENSAAADALVAELEKIDCDCVKDILDKKAYLPKKSVWIMGGDGWAYDIGFGGLDHVLASGENINVMVFDMEM